jgi:hypothetical protein
MVDWLMLQPAEFGTQQHAREFAWSGVADTHPARPGPLKGRNRFQVKPSRVPQQ